MPDITQILDQIEQGDVTASNKLLPLVYDELRRLAANKMAQEGPGQTLQATALVHEAYLRLVGSETGKSYHDRRHFFAVAATAMRRILVDHARAKQSVKRGGDLQREALLDVAQSLPDHELLFCDKTIDLDDICETLRISRSTLYRYVTRFHPKLTEKHNEDSRN